MNDNDVSTKRLIKSLRICLFCLAAFFLTATAFSQPSLAIKFNPTVAITGLPGSVQQVQYTTDLANSNSWATIGFATVTANPTYFTDTGANGQSRFYRTITVGLAVIQTGRVVNVPALMAGSLLSALPAVVVYLIFQRNLIQGLTMGVNK